MRCVSCSRASRRRTSRPRSLYSVAWAASSKATSTLPTTTLSGRPNRAGPARGPGGRRRLRRPARPRGTSRPRRPRRWSPACAPAGARSGYRPARAHEQQNVAPRQLFEKFQRNVHVCTSSSAPQCPYPIPLSGLRPPGGDVRSGGGGLTAAGGAGVGSGGTRSAKSAGTFWAHEGTARR